LALSSLRAAQQLSKAVLGDRASRVRKRGSRHATPREARRTRGGGGSASARCQRCSARRHSSARRAAAAAAQRATRSAMTDGTLLCARTSAPVAPPTSCACSRDRRTRPCRLDGRWLCKA
jgi:hypothetical protein